MFLEPVTQNELHHSLKLPVKRPLLLSNTTKQSTKLPLSHNKRLSSLYRITGYLRIALFTKFQKILAIFENKFL